jgi:hypothetical protein
MARLARVTNIIFAGTSPLNTMEQFGSFVVSGVPNYTTDPAVIQGLAAWGDGWSVAINAGNKAPYLQDMNAVLFVLSRQLSYIFQQGISEWDAATTYYIGSYVQLNDNSGQIFRSLQDNNIGNLPPSGASNAFWQWTNPPAVTVPNFGNSLTSNLRVIPNAGTPLTKIDISADLISIQGTALTTLAQTINITVVGANGIDTGTVTTNTLYAVYAITNASGSLSAGLISLSGTSPTLPAGYTQFRLIAWMKTNGSAQISFLSADGDYYAWTAPFAGGGTFTITSAAFTPNLPAAWARVPKIIIMLTDFQSSAPGGGASECGFSTAAGGTFGGFRAGPSLYQNCRINDTISYTGVFNSGAGSASFTLMFRASAQ